MATAPGAIGGAAFIERKEAQIERRRSGRPQDQDLDLPRWTVPLEEIDETVRADYRVDARLFSAHGRSVGCAKSVAATGRPERPRHRRTLWDVRLGHRGESTAIGDAA